VVLFAVVSVRGAAIVEIEKIQKGNASVIGDMMAVMVDQSWHLGEFLERSPGYKCGYKELA
jgi:hypothetical protein